MNPFFFGTSDKQLFGVHHPPEREERSEAAVLLCPSYGHEYIAGHPSLQHVAAGLARRGFHALRFDYFGCGDSAGEMDEVSVEQWVSDVRTAIQELKDTSGARRVCLVGLRLGAAIAAVAASAARAAGDRSVVAAALWDPVVKGVAFVAELEELQQNWLRAMYVRRPRDTLFAEGPELMGFPMPDALSKGLQAIDLSALTGPIADRTLVIDTQGDPALAALRAHLGGLGADAELEHVPSMPAYFGQHWQTIALPPQEVVRKISEWMAGAHK